MQITQHDTNIKLVGHWTIDVFEGDTDKQIDKIQGYNLITTAGKGLLLDRLFALGGATNITGMAIGTSGTAAAIGDTAITGAAFKTFDATPTRAGTTVTATTTYGTAEGNINIQEIGLLTASGGILFNRIAPVGPFNKTSAVSIRITVTLTQN